MNSSPRKILENPLASTHYGTLVIISTAFNLFLMLLSSGYANPSSSNPQGVVWFKICILLLVPAIGTFSFCLLASLMLPRRVTLSPAYVNVFTFLPAVLMGTYVEYASDSLYAEPLRMSMVASFALLAIVAYVSMIYLSIYALQPIIRSLVGSYGELDNIRTGTRLYSTSLSIKQIIHKMEDGSWLSNLCSMNGKIERKEENRLQVKLSKYQTNFYVVFCAEKSESGTLIGLTPCELRQNLATKDIAVTDESLRFLQPQITEIEEELKLAYIPAEKACAASELDFFLESVDYAMSPARFPLLFKYRNQIIVLAVCSFLSVVALAAYFAHFIEVQTFVSIIAIIVASGGTAISVLSRK